jgi:LacI family transcriptional regulator
LIPPFGVVTRQSTDVLSIDDRNVARAINFIRKNACNGINVRDLIKAVPQSRRLLEKKFKKLLGRTPHEEILRVQLDRVKELLTQTGLPLEQIAERAGFTHVEYLSVAFKREVGLPPSGYRSVNKPRAKVNAEGAIIGRDIPRPAAGKAGRRAGAARRGKTNA